MHTSRIIKLLREQTLPVAMLTGTIIYLLFRFTPCLQCIRHWYAPYNDSVLPDFMFLILFVTFCKVDITKLRLVRWHLYVVLQQMFFVALMVCSILALSISGQSLILMEALLVCIIGPCAAAAAVVTAKLGGSLEEMTSYTFVSNFVAALLIPLCFPLLPGGDSTMDVEFLPLFGSILWKVSAVLVLPMILANVLKFFLPRVHRYIVSIPDLSYYLWGGSLVVVTGTTAMSIADAWAQTDLWFLLLVAVMALLLCILQFAMGRYLGHFSGKANEAGQSLGQKNTAFAIWAATAFLNPLSSVGPGCYIIWQNIISSIEISLKQKGKLK